MFARNEIRIDEEKFHPSILPHLTASPRERSGSYYAPHHRPSHFTTAAVRERTASFS
jgi:hypothetical protein